MIATLSGSFFSMNKPALRRVRKEDIHSIESVKRDPIDICLECWRFFLGSDGTGSLDIKTMRGLRGLSDAYGVDSSEQQLARDFEIGAATDAMISGMRVQHQWALKKSVGLCSVWRFDRLDLLEVVQVARVDLEARLRKNPCTSNCF